MGLFREKECSGNALVFNIINVFITKLVIKQKELLIHGSMVELQSNQRLNYDRINDVIDIYFI